MAQHRGIKDAETQSPDLNVNDLGVSVSLKSRVSREVFFNTLDKVVTGFKHCSTNTTRQSWRGCGRAFFKRCSRSLGSEDQKLGRLQVAVDIDRKAFEKAEFCTA